ncbi:Cytochrome c oxidase polypeptide III [Labilithrix luteola]|uniref:Cytochrome c oxidase polypeptide III n=1 Tax=Labilithrix luteola TaxID=1391654 RepID=A0A0K1PVF1_9BACT|nr:cytochrome c oxidase subunit 3 [Labilithrix luteola]AKU97508.1 Cytochrome c oxidase polypeptide III [Labilithrix luteola]
MKPAFEHEAHFESVEQQAHASRLGMWVFLASEVLLFAALFTIVFTYRAHSPHAFRESVLHNTKVLGSVNTAVLLTSSTLVAFAVHVLREGKTKLAGRLVLATIGLGFVFLVIKFTEYGLHFHEGIYPRGVGEYFVTHTARGYVEFWTLYFTMTGLHAIHVTIGMGVLAAMRIGMGRGTVTEGSSHRLETAALYWHLVDLVWIFLWPVFYLA